MVFENRYEYFTVVKQFKEQLIYLCAQNTLQEKGTSRREHIKLNFRD